MSQPGEGPSLGAATPASHHMIWIVDILECIGGGHYTGVTHDTKRRGPFTVRYIESLDSKGAALQREAAIKSLDRATKMALIASLP